ncbi:hypothetical protein [Nitrosopumilus zosterae]|nr:hypothetical protein [Nitrosopumilus zosterae]BDQ30435.1 hypothetical protein NZOSNM25_000538 [Nitrosopumilus zosterae]
MGYKRRNNRYNKPNRRKGDARPKLAIIGAISLAIGILLVHYVGIPAIYSEGKFDDNPALIVGMVGIVSGVVMLLLSLNKKRQGQLAGGMEAVGKAFEPDCNCCKCTNCDRNHNHWTHD